MKIRDFLIGVGAQVDRSSFNQAENATKSLKNGLYAITGAIGALAGAGYIVKRFVDDVAKVGDETIKTARNLGVGAEAWQEWQYVAGLAGVQTGDFSNAIKFLQRGIAEAGEGTGTALKGFQRLGISVKNNDGTLKSYDQILKEVAERLPQLNEAERVATSMDLFSRSGVKMIDMLMQGNEEIQRFRQRAHDLGIVMSVDMMNAMEEYNDRSEDFEAVIFGMKTQIANALIPSMTKFAVTLTNNLVPAIKWLKDNSEQLKSTLQFVGKAFLWVAGATALWGLGALTTGIIGLTSKLALLGWAGIGAFAKMLIMPLLVGASVLVLGAMIKELYSALFTKDKTIFGYMLDDLKNIIDFWKTELQGTVIGDWLGIGKTPQQRKVELEIIEKDPSRMGAFGLVKGGFNPMIYAPKPVPVVAPPNIQSNVGDAKQSTNYFSLNNVNIVANDPQELADTLKTYANGMAQ